MKSSKNQRPSFDLYHYDGTDASKTSSIFYFKEGQEYNIDSVLDRRVAIDSNADFIFAHSMVNLDDDSLYFYKLYDLAYQHGALNDGHPVSTYSYKTIWREGPGVNVQYSKYDTTGTIINQDAFINYKNYYW